MDNQSHQPQSDDLIPFNPVALRTRRDGWTADKQRDFIASLAETGCVETAAREVGMNPRSAYRLVARPDAAAFANAWDDALLIASRRLNAAAFDYALHGLPEAVWKDGEVVATRRRPSEKLLMFLLTHLDPLHFGALARSQTARSPRVVAARTLHKLTDTFRDLPDQPAPDDRGSSPRPPARPSRS